MLRLNDLNTAVDEVHSYFDKWGDKHLCNGSTDMPDSALHEARLAVHEWTANLVQHADFEERRPLIALKLQKRGDAIHCVIIDNSDGFDLEEQLKESFEKNNVKALPDRGMGLLMLHTCASNLSYEAAKGGRYRLSFQVTPDGGGESPNFLTKDLPRNAA